MALPLWAIGALAGAGKSALVDMPNQARDAELQARTAELSPWTGLQARQVQKADMFGDALSGGLTGASMAQNKKEQAQKQSVLDTQREIEQRRLGLDEQLMQAQMKQQSAQDQLMRQWMMMNQASRMPQ